MRLDRDIGFADMYYRRFEFPGLTCQIRLLPGACCLSLRPFAFGAIRRTRALGFALDRLLKGKVFNEGGFTGC
jgi:hypothetical protein